MAVIEAEEPQDLAEHRLSQEGEPRHAQLRSGTAFRGDVSKQHRRARQPVERLFHRLQRGTIGKRTAGPLSREDAFVDLDVRIVGTVFAQVVRLRAVFVVIPGHDGRLSAHAGATDRDR